MRGIAVLPRIERWRVGTKLKGSSMFRVFFFVMLLHLPSIVYSKEFTSCSQAISELDNGNVTDARERLRSYIIDSFQQGEQDSRCDLNFVNKLTKRLVLQLDSDYLQLCREGLDQPDIEGLAAMDLIVSRIQSLGYQLTSLASRCQTRYREQYEGISWLQNQNPEVADILVNCHLALKILDSPMSEIRLSQANAFIRAAELGVMREQEAGQPARISSWVRNLYRFRFIDAKDCVLKARLEFDQFNQTPR